MKRKYEIAVLSKGSYARTVRIYSPKKADRAVIMHDGQNVFYDEETAYKKSWRVLDALNGLGIKNTAVIGIDCVPASRMDDYLPFPTELDVMGINTMGGKLEPYCDYIDDIIIPYLNKRFGYKRYAMLGSSAGATATLGYAARKNKLVTAYGLFSTPLFVSAKAFEDFFAKTTFDSGASYYVYVGGNEQPDLNTDGISVPDLYVESACTLVKSLRRGGAKKLRLRIENDGVHDEISWRAPEGEFISDFSKQ